MEPPMTSTADRVSRPAAGLTALAQRALATVLAAVGRIAERQVFPADRASTLVDAGWRATSRLT
jgi:hypothetical protein